MLLVKCSFAGRTPWTSVFAHTLTLTNAIVLVQPWDGYCRLRTQNDLLLVSVSGKNPVYTNRRPFVCRRGSVAGRCNKLIRSSLNCNCTRKVHLACKLHGEKHTTRANASAAGCWCCCYHYSRSGNGVPTLPASVSNNTWATLFEGSRWVTCEPTSPSHRDSYPARASEYRW